MLKDSDDYRHALTFFQLLASSVTDYKVDANWKTLLLLRIRKSFFRRLSLAWWQKKAISDECPLLLCSILCYCVQCPARLTFFYKIIQRENMFAYKVKA